MAKLTLNVAPTFQATVDIPAAGGEVLSATLTFKHRTKDALQAWLKGSGKREDVDAIMEMMEGWDLDEPFNVENVKTLCQNYIAAPAVIVEAYIDHLAKARVKN